MKNARRFLCAAGLFVAVAGLLLVPLFIGGCASSPQAQLDTAKSLYNATLGEIDDLREAGQIDAGTYHNVITPVRKSAWAAIQKADVAVKTGQTDQLKTILDSVNASLLELQKYRKKVSSLAPSATQPAQAAVDPISAALLLLGLINRLAPVVQKALSGTELTDEERKVLDDAAVAENARADRLDAEASA